MTVMAARPSSADFLKGAVRRNIFPLMESHYEAELDEVLLRPIAPLNPTSPSPSAPPFVDRFRALGGPVYPRRAGANTKPFPRGAPMQQLATCRNPELPNDPAYQIAKRWQGHAAT